MLGKFRLLNRHCSTSPLAGGFLQCGTFLLLFPVLSIFFSCSILIFGGRTGATVSIVILCIAAAFSAVMSGTLFNASYWKTIPACAAIMAMSIWAAAAVYDTSCDGQEYHFDGAYVLSQGWNPYWDNGIPNSTSGPAPNWVLFYPKGAWAFSALLMASGLPAESAKCINFIILCSSLMIVAGMLIFAGLHPASALILGSAAALNPVALGELFTRMNDGLLGGSILIFISGLLMSVAFNSWRGLVLAGFSLAFAMELKFSAIPIFGVLGLFALSANWYRNGARAALIMATALGAAGIVSIFYMGWNPYVTNFLGFGHPFHPLMGAHRLNFMEWNRPESLKPMISISRLLFSLFAETDVRTASDLHLKLPFSVTAQDLDYAGVPDARVGGFGPLFSGALLLGAAGIILLALKGRNRSLPAAALIVCAGLSASVLIMPENWWARFVPHVWLLPCAVAAGLLLMYESKRLLLGWAIIGAIWMNLLISGGKVIAAAPKHSAAVSQQIHKLKLRKAEICVYSWLAHSRISLFKEAGLQIKTFTKPEDLPCKGLPAVVDQGQVCYCGDYTNNLVYALSP
jgi:hypothetical protein